MLSNTLRLNFCYYLKIIHTLHPHYRPKIIGHILKYKLKNKCVCIHEIIVVTKIGNDHKPPQMTTNHQQMITKHQQTNTNYQQTISFLLSTPDNCKEHPDFEKRTLSVPNKLVRIVGWCPTKVSSINRRGVLIKEGFDKNGLI